MGIIARTITAVMAILTPTRLLAGNPTPCIEQGFEYAFAGERSILDEFAITKTGELANVPPHSLMGEDMDDRTVMHFLGVRADDKGVPTNDTAVAPPSPPWMDTAMGPSADTTLRGPPTSDTAMAPANRTNRTSGTVLQATTSTYGWEEDKETAYFVQYCQWRCQQFESKLCFFFTYFPTTRVCRLLSVDTARQYSDHAISGFKSCLFNNRAHREPFFKHPVDASTLAAPLPKVSSLLHKFWTIREDEIARNVPSEASVLNPPFSYGDAAANSLLRSTWYRPDWVAIEAKLQREFWTPKHLNATVKELEALGAKTVFAERSVINAQLPIESIPKAAELKTISSITTPRMHKSGSAVRLDDGRHLRRRLVGSVTTEGDQSIATENARKTFEVSGAGTRCVGAISGSYAFTTYPYYDYDTGYFVEDRNNTLAIISSGDLPPFLEEDDDDQEGPFSKYVVSFDSERYAFPYYYGRDEGAEISEICFDVAPETNIAFASAQANDGGQAGFAQAIRAIKEQHNCEGEFDDLILFDEPFFELGVAGEAIEEVVGKGTAYYTGVGNLGPTGYVSEFVDSGYTGPNNGPLHDFNPDPHEVQPFLEFQIFPEANDNEVTFILQWDEPFGGAETDLDMFIAFSDDRGILTTFNTVGISTGGVPFNLVQGYTRGSKDPQEIAFFFNAGDANCVDGDDTNCVFRLFVERVSGPWVGHGAPPAPGRIQILLSTNADARAVYLPVNIRGEDVIVTNGSSIFGHSNTPSALVVATAPFNQTQCQDPCDFEPVDPAQLEPFSSSGGTPILFDENGHRIVPIVPRHPDIAGPDRVSTTRAPTDFFGSSAATPHIVGLGQLMVEANPSLTPFEIYQIIIDTANPIEPPLAPPFNFISGNGFANGFRAVEEALNRLSPAMRAERLERMRKKRLMGKGKGKGSRNGKGKGRMRGKG
ncbi:unnamed protein product [Vitrella brassicaformis CCMP3155]|uniref:subtilisin n=2 Tax=Vitrella brassicaformis TaxID=1169539 RepID=A0A0G4FXJ0_VITBC|nr:unnamed protein product [Vitrella brassicaformis CCMP3155]|eukprot:CEM19729.1 unnamed protein product [Vitrella brassicaformis CCMP3155]